MMRGSIRLLAALGAATAPALAAPETRHQILYDATLDIDGDGKADHLALVLAGTRAGTGFYGPEKGVYMLGDGDRVDLHVYLGTAGPGRDPDFVKTDIVDAGRAWGVGTPEDKGRGSFAIGSCFGCGAIQSMEETLTIVHRRGRFLVGGYSLSWDWNTHAADGVRTSMGDCEINLLTGKAFAAYDGSGRKPVRGTFRPVRLADWSEATRPKACDAIMSRAVEASRKR